MHPRILGLKMRKIGFAILFTFFLIEIFVYCRPSLISAIELGDEVVVTVDSAKLRKDNSEKGEIICILPKGTTITIINISEGNWYWVKLSEGSYGFIHGSCVKEKLPTRKEFPKPRSEAENESPFMKPRTGRRHYQVPEEPEPTPEREYQWDLREYHQRDLKEALWMETLRYLTISQAPYLSPQVEKMLDDQRESTTELCIEILRTEGKEKLDEYTKDCCTYAYTYGYSKASIYQDPYQLADQAKFCAALLLAMASAQALMTIQREQQAQEGGKFVWVEVKSANIRDGPSTQHKVIDQAKYNTRLLAIEESGKWYKVMSVDGFVGWIYAPLCSKEAQKGSNKIFPLEISKEVREVVVPNVLGRRLGQAKEILERAGLKVGRIDYVCDIEKLFDIILRQNPRPGKTVPKSTPVNLTINAGEE